MEQILACSLCFNNYDLRAFRPKTLPCGHSLCEQCLGEWFRKKKALTCPNDSRYFPGTVGQVPDNHAIIEVLKALEVRCDRHSQVVAESFCLTHLCAICVKCRHQEVDCNVLSLLEDSVAISSSILRSIDKSRRRVGLAQLPADIATALQHRFHQPIEENIKLLRRLVELEGTCDYLDCAKCEGAVDALFDVYSFDGYCSTCIPRDDAYMVDISGLTSDELKALMAEKARRIGRRVNADCVTLEVAEIMQSGAKAVAREWQQVGKHLLLWESPARWKVSDLPFSVLCPQCLQPKTHTDLRLLPCTQLHVLCSHCALQRSDSVVCPLDGTQHSVLSLRPLLETNTLSRETACKSSFSQPKSPTLLPPLVLPHGVHCLTRFPSVLPRRDTAVCEMTADNFGWRLPFPRTVIEAVSFTCSAQCVLVGVGVATPIARGDACILESVALYTGRREEFVAVHCAKKRIEGGNDVIEYVRFSSEFPVPAQTITTLKLRFVPLTGIKEVWLYRGFPRPRERNPEAHDSLVATCTGSDGAVWVFDEPRESRQNSFSGPILRLLYTR